MDINGVIRVNMTGAEIEEALLKARDLPTNAQLTTILNEMQTDIDARLGRIEEKTYDEMVALRDAAELVPGQLYRITDYVTTTKVEHTQSAGHPFDIVVLALSPNTLSEAAMAMVHEGDEYFAGINLSAWQLKYTLDNIEHSASDGKGTITFMHDERNCEACFDFKNIQFKRWKVTDSRDRSNLNNKYVGIMGTMPASLTIPDESDYVWSWLFGVDDPLRITTIQNVDTTLKVSDNTVLGNQSKDCKIFGTMRECTWTRGIINSTVGYYVYKCIGTMISDCLFQSSSALSSFGGNIINSCIFGALTRVETGYGHDTGEGGQVDYTLVISDVRSTTFRDINACVVSAQINTCDFSKAIRYCSFSGPMNTCNVTKASGRIELVDFKSTIFNQIIELTRNNVTVAMNSNGVLKIWNPADLVQ